MSSPVVSGKFRAVLCRHCAKPIRVPALVMKKESEFQSLTDASDIHYHLISRVFNVRCRCCERESVYSINQIIDYPFAMAPAPGDCKAASA
jgi:hypothetical protein